MRACAEEVTESYDPVDAHIRVCDAELCNDECEDCECSDSAAEDFMCYECDVRDSECKGTNGRDISQTACPSEKCLISGTPLLYVTYKLLLMIMPTSIHSIPMQ